jgi:hypothetical protein
VFKSYCDARPPEATLEASAKPPLKLRTRGLKEEFACAYAVYKESLRDAV